MTRLIDLTGVRFGRLIVQQRVGSIKHGAGTAPVWSCVCECGKHCVVSGPCLRGGFTKSCGCIQLRHGAYAGRSNRPIPEYSVWTSMIQRCENPSSQQFSSYGGRGISVCERWHDPARFLLDMGPRPGKGYSLDRIDVNGNYEPGNCRWATAIEQANNKRTNHVLVVEGRALNISEWARETGIFVSTIRERIKRGWSPERAISVPTPSSRAHGSLAGGTTRSTSTPETDPSE